jgi:site-specific DNA-methyltransferase (adenine-specific)/adenine-specific DNA-methyltransferase
MNEELRQRIIERLRRGEDLPREWAQEIFPPEKMEYELVYHGKEREGDIIANTMAVPLQEVRTFGKNGDDGWRSMLILGDNLQVLKRLLEMKREGRLCNADGTPGVRLVYIDPPFGTGDEYGGKDAEIAYSAKKRGTEFIDFVRRRLVLLRELLADDGSICVRLDYHFGHYVKVIMDEIFLQNFQNEIVINRVKRQLRNLNRLNVSTESILYYSKSSSFYFANPESPRVCNLVAPQNSVETA